MHWKIPAISIESRRRRGRQRISWLDAIINSMDISLCKLWEVVKDRGAWHATDHGVAKNWTQLSDWTTTTTTNQAYRWSYWLRSQGAVQKNSEFCSRHLLDGGAGCWDRGYQRRGRVSQGKGGDIPWALNACDIIVKSKLNMFSTELHPFPKCLAHYSLEYSRCSIKMDCWSYSYKVLGADTLPGVYTLVLRVPRENLEKSVFEHSFLKCKCFHWNCLQFCYLCMSHSIQRFILSKNDLE